MDGPENPEKPEIKSTLPFLVDSMLNIEKTRVRTQVRSSHLKLRQEVDPRTEQVLDLLRVAEEKIDKWVAEELKYHPAYPWFSRIKGIGNENIAKVIGFIDIKKARTISSLWKFAGMDVVHSEVSREKQLTEINDSIEGLRKKLEDLQKKSMKKAEEISADGTRMTPIVIGELIADIGSKLESDITPVIRGRAPRREKGEKLTFNSELRVMCFRLAGSFLKAQGKYAEFYYKEKKKLISRYENEGKKIIPTLELTKKNGKFFEPVGVISENHVHMQAMRKMIKLFLSHLWIVWRKAEKLPITEPYAYSVLGHTRHDYITPEDMIEKPEKKLTVKKKIGPEVSLPIPDHQAKNETAAAP